MCPIIVHDSFLHFKNKGPYLFISKPIPCECTPYFKKTHQDPRTSLLKKPSSSVTKKMFPCFLVFTTLLCSQSAL
ncbi:hypothetical protein YC2023_076667 [Brassica napus]|uniref:Uncharacterized protein n=1 Tax=Brassica oleracea var. oleracea TaxID=109376 RepID=A0A0D3CR96_BRAOL